MLNVPAVVLGGEHEWIFRKSKAKSVFGSEFTTVDPDGILMQGQRLPTPNSPLEVIVVVVWRKGSRIDPI
ncbi:hypothetical protein CRG98_029149 [Punica granatum]|uniref:Uncharacterized protein n=1 Tax=Punica granatum TaxID=22663 RepID=A0A2I0J3Z7_PUNGR|nr:hypothetical protein CRG98_029149 [Punica granatum]